VSRFQASREYKPCSHTHIRALGPHIPKGGVPRGQGFVGAGMCMIGGFALARGLRRVYVAGLEGSRVRSIPGWGGGTVRSVSGSPSQSHT